MLGGLQNFLMIVFFFVIAEISTRFARKKNAENHEKRTTGNILGNSGAAIIALGLNSQIAFFGAISAALADTLSSEIGLLSKKKPRLITTFKEVEPGTDGGITILGTVASFLGAGLVAIIHSLLNGNPFALAALVFAGVAGSFVDSFFGAGFERSNVLNNAEVNFLGSSAGAIIAYSLLTLL